MKNLLLLAMSLPLVACVVDVDPPPGDGTGGGSGSGTGSGSGGDTGLSGSITQSATWSGTVNFKAPTTIESGVVITVDPGTTLAFAGSASLTVKGTLDVKGTAAGKVNIKATGTYFSGITNTGTLKYSYVVQKGGGIYTQTGSTSTITDSLMSNVSGDFLVMGGGDLTMTYSQIGQLTGDSTHCQLHFNSTGTVSITKSNIVGAPYGFMFYGGSGTFTNNNWMGNTDNVSLSGNGPGDFSGGYFQGAAPSGTGITLNNKATAKLTDAGPRG